MKKAACLVLAVMILIMSIKPVVVYAAYEPDDDFFGFFVEFTKQRNIIEQAKVLVTEYQKTGLSFDTAYNAAKTYLSNSYTDFQAGLTAVKNTYNNLPFNSKTKLIDFYLNVDIDAPITIDANMANDLNLNLFSNNVVQNTNYQAPTLNTGVAGAIPVEYGVFVTNILPEFLGQPVGSQSMTDAMKAYYSIYPQCLVRIDFKYINGATVIDYSYRYNYPTRMPPNIYYMSDRIYLSNTALSNGAYTYYANDDYKGSAYLNSFSNHYLNVKNGSNIQVSYEIFDVYSSVTINPPTTIINNYYQSNPTTNVVNYYTYTPVSTNSNPTAVFESPDFEQMIKDIINGLQINVTVDPSIFGSGGGGDNGEGDNGGGGDTNNDNSTTNNYYDNSVTNNDNSVTNNYYEENTYNDNTTNNYYEENNTYNDNTTNTFYEDYITNNYDETINNFYDIIENYFNDNSANTHNYYNFNFYSPEGFPVNPGEGAADGEGSGNFLLDLISGLITFKDILDSIFQFIKDLLIPSEGFIESKRDELFQKLNDKLSINAQLDLIRSLSGSTQSTQTFSLSEFSAMDESERQALLSNTVSAMSGRSGFSSYEDMYVEVMGVNAKILDARFLNETAPVVRDWIKGLIYLITVVYNLNQAYKLIRGTYLFKNYDKEGE